MCQKMGAPARALLLIAAVAGSASAQYIAPDPRPTPTTDVPLAEQHAALGVGLDGRGALPASFDWRTVAGVVSPIRSQYLPEWCGSCWAHAVTSSLADRVNVLRTRPGYVGERGSVLLSVQNLLDCGLAGRCSGGSWERAFAWARSHGVCDDSCSPYKGRDGTKCEPCSLMFENKTSVPVPGARRFRVKDFGYFNASTLGSTTSEPAAIAEMQNEIAARGPIVCSMETNDDHNELGAWHCYEGGVYRTKNVFKSTNHVISLLGWGEDEDEDRTPYWIGRHSGGTIFGEEGFFRIERGVNALNIESNCGWATVLDPNPGREDVDAFPCENGVARPYSPAPPY
eukprot:SAG31_NODE_1542_length_7951_cov_4.038844_5_plen_341_part_00